MDTSDETEEPKQPMLNDVETRDATGGPKQSMNIDKTGKCKQKTQFASLETEFYKFTNLQDFQKWKENVEDKTVSCYVKKKGDTRSSTGTVSQVYQCHRSGHYLTRGNGTRKLKIQGSCKIGKSCHSFIRVKIRPSGIVEVRYAPKHNDHVNDVAHLTMRRHERQFIAEMLAAGSSFDDVLDKVEMSTDHPSVSHLQFLTKKDLQNILRDFNLPKVRVWHTDDAQSVALFQPCTGDKSESASEGVYHLGGGRLQQVISSFYTEMENIGIDSDEQGSSLIPRSSEEKSYLQPPRPETEAIPKSLQKPNLEDVYLSTREALSFITQIMEQHPELLYTVNEHVLRLKSLLIAMTNKPEVSRLPSPSRHPANQRAGTQRRFYSTKTDLKKRKKALKISKPNSNQKEFLLDELSGVHPATSRDQIINDHDYSRINADPKV